MDPLGILKQVVESALRIKSAFENAGRNSEDCHMIDGVLGILRPIAEQHGGQPGTLRDATDLLKGAMRRASGLIAKCEGEGLVRRAYEADDVARDLGRLRSDLQLILNMVVAADGVQLRADIVQLRADIVQLLADVAIIKSMLETHLGNESDPAARPTAAQLMDHSFVKDHATPRSPRSGMTGDQMVLRHGGRTAYHFQPAKNWMNDPNGPLYHNGMYHFFYQYNPHGPQFGTGKLSWGHSVSRDLVHWAFLGTAIDPTSPFDDKGCWSGSATTLADGQPAILYTGRDADDVQVQNVAFAKNPSDPLLREWTKPSCNPVVPRPTDVTNNDFRDPSTAWLGRDGLWRFAVGAEVDGVGVTLVYRSADFLRWERNAAPLHASPGAHLCECPDFFPVTEGGTEGLDTSANGPGVRHVLKLSKVADEDYYMVGRYDDEADTFEPAEEDDDDFRNWRRIDHGHMFGAKTFFDARKSRRVMWAWVDETDSCFDKGWAGITAFPRVLWLDADGKQLVQWPVEEIETLRRKRVDLLGAEVGSGGLHEIAGIDSRQADVEVVFDIPNLEDAERLDSKWLKDPRRCEEEAASRQGGVGPFGLVVMASDDMSEQTTVYFRVFEHDGKYKVLMCTDLTRSSTKEVVHKPVYAGFVDVDVEKDRSISLRTLIDHSIIESFGGGGRTCITARVYPEHVAAGASTHLYVFNNGPGAVTVSKLEAWELATASVNVEDLLDDDVESNPSCTVSS